MATQFMPSPSYMGVPHTSAPNGYAGPKNGGFSFQKRLERVDWRKIASVDIDTISRTLDFTTLQENIMNITFCNLEAELDIRSVDPNFVKLFKLAQLTIEYLLHSQEYLAGLCASLEEKSKQSEQEVGKVKAELEAAQKEVTEVKKESHKRKKLLIAQQQLMYAGSESYNKCPFCAKAFLNNSYLQSHITRRHGAGSGKTSGSSSVSPDLGVGSESANNVDAEISHIKERLLQQEAELQEERRALNSLKNKDLRVLALNGGESKPEDTEEEGQAGPSAVLMREIQELNAKLQASQKAQRELEARTGGKRSYLGDMEDDVENEKELLKEQRGEVAALKEQLEQQLNQMSDHMQRQLDKQEKKWQKKVHHMTQQHASEIKKLNNALESTSRSLEGNRSPHIHKQQQEVEELLKKSREQEKALEVQEQMMEKEISRTRQSEVKALKTTPRGTTPRGMTPRGTTPRGGKSPQATAQIKHSSMYPSDEEESAAFGTGTSSLHTIDRTTGNGSSLGVTGTQSLHTNEFLEEMRKNPTLGVMRQELARLLEDDLEKKGIPLNQRGISDQVLQNKLSMLGTQRQNYVQKYSNFMALREQLNKQATEKAKQQLKLQTRSPRYPPSSGPRRKLDMSPHTPRQVPASPSKASQNVVPHPQQHLRPNSNSKSHNRSASPGRGPSPSPRPQPRAKTPLSTGSTTEWTSTQFDSDSDSEEDLTEEKGVPVFSPSPGARLIQSGPAGGRAPSPAMRGNRGPSPRNQSGPQPRLIVSKPLNNEDIDDLLESDGEDRRAPSPSSRLTSSNRKSGNVSNLANSIQSQLGARKAKPFGGVNVGTNKQIDAEDFEESDWDDTTAGGDPEPVAMRRPANRASTDGMSTNTYGTSAWGTSSKVASTVKDKERRSTSRSSFVSVTDVSSDEEMNVDNI